MRIAIVLAATPGYSETFFTSKIRGLQAQGHEVLIMVGRRSSRFDLCKVHIAPKVYNNALLQLPVMGIRLLSLLPYLGSVRRFVELEKKENTSFSEILKKIYLNAHIFPQRVDWLHFGFATQAVDREFVAKAIGAKMGVSFRGFDINVYPVKHPNCYKKLWKQVDKVHSISNYLLHKAHTLGLSKETPSQVITPAIVMEELPKAINASKKERLQLVTIARITWIKGLDIAIEALRILKEDGIDATYHIIGDGIQKDEEKYKFMSYEYGLTDHIHFHGKLTHEKTLEQVQQADIYIQPSLNEGFCNAVLESQALGSLTIASNVGGLPENIVDGQTGWLFPVGDAKALALKIKSVMKLTSEEKEKIVKAAKDRVAREFTVAQQQKEFVEFYTSDL